MQFTFPWPYSPGEWFAFCAAALTVAIGLALVGLALAAARRAGPGMAAALPGGLLAGLGVVPVLFAQPLLYLALAAAWLAAALAEAATALAAGGGTGGRWLRVLAALVLGLVPGAYAVGLLG
ncbi:hypothetical protein N1F89_16135 [Aquibium sp. A9E412]|uniref:hypothetical protein n=1 Tax=Aquibium sp. A9E412 TaxID=2976767 RepID=UPI0025B140BD|nr:hypothetical protein [Aquibium sp. A9E412]MDN2567752.1 hypothetical protein [Aquibium sp. A9E412]